MKRGHQKTDEPEVQNGPPPTFMKASVGFGQCTKLPIAHSTSHPFERKGPSWGARFTPESVRPKPPAKKKSKRQTVCLH